MSPAKKQKKVVSQITLKGPKKFFTVLLAGGPADMYRKLKEKLAACRGIFLKYHWEYKSNDCLGVIPADVDFVLCLKDMMGHKDCLSVRTEAKRRSRPIIVTHSEWSIMVTALYQRGIRHQAPLLLRELEEGPRKIVQQVPEPPKFNQIVAHEVSLIPKIGNKEISVQTFQCIQTLQRALLSDGIAAILISKSSIEISQE